MRVLGIVGSPRPNGNTDILVDEVLSGVRSAGGTIDKIYISDFDVRPCQSCMVCKGGQGCPQEDQFAEIASRVEKAEAVILGSPVYWNCVTAQMKVFMDRCFKFLNDRFESSLAGKKGAFVVACGAPEESMTSLTKVVMHDFLKFNGIEVIGDLAATGVSEKGDVLKKEEAMTRAFQLGRKFLN